MAEEQRDGPEIVVVGGGFAGLNVARGLRRAPARLTLVDRRNHHLFQPLLYQVATGGLSPADIASPLRHLLRRGRDTHVLLAEVVDFDLEGRRVLLADGELAYDLLVVAAGAEPSYFGHEEWERFAPGLKDLEDARRIRSQVLGAFEAAEREPDPERRRALITFVLVGGGPTGVELAGAIAELARDTLRQDFRVVNTAESRILLLEGGPRVLGAFPERLSAAARRQLEGLGVEVLTDTFVTDVQAGRVRVRRGEREFEIPAASTVWAAGVRPSALGRVLAGRAGMDLDPQGRLPVTGHLTLPGHPDVYVLGDLARCEGPDGEPLPALAAVAMQQGRYLARALRDRLAGRAPAPFRYRDKGLLATIGRSAAVAHVRRLDLHGFPAWLLWLAVHLLYLVGFANRLLVLLQWSWSYLTRKRTARLITGALPTPRSGAVPDPPEAVQEDLPTSRQQNDPPKDVPSR